MTMRLALVEAMLSSAVPSRHRTLKDASSGHIPPSQDQLLQLKRHKSSVRGQLCSALTSLRYAKLPFKTLKPEDSFYAMIKTNKVCAKYLLYIIN